MQELIESALTRIAAARTTEELEAVRVEVLGRKGVLAGLSKDMGKLSPEERAARGKFINAAKQSLEAALEERRSDDPLELVSADRRGRRCQPAPDSPKNACKRSTPARSDESRHGSFSRVPMSSLTPAMEATTWPVGRIGLMVAD